MIGVVDALKNHLILRDILRVNNEFREHKHTFPLQLFQCLIGDLSSKNIDIRESIFFYLCVVLNL